MVQAEDLRNIETNLEDDFNIDQAFKRVFGNHPLYNAIAWNYMCDGSRERGVVTEAFYGPTTESMAPYARSRFREPQYAGVQFWALYARWLAPSYKHVADWRKDMVRHIINIMIKFSISSIKAISVRS